jgi:hypothetical protein
MFSKSSIAPSFIFKSGASGEIMPEKSVSRKELIWMRVINGNLETLHILKWFFEILELILLDPCLRMSMNDI